VTVTWTVKVVDKWFEICRDKNPGYDCYDEAHKRFGRWVHSASYGSCFWLGDKVEKYLESKGADVSLIMDAVEMFRSIAMKIEVEYNEQVYEALKEALKHIAETDEDDLMKAHAKALIELIETAERLKSAIVCSG